MRGQPCTLLFGDCLTHLNNLMPASVDLALTSPPYDSLRKYQGLSFEDFKCVAHQLLRTLKQGGVLVWVVGDSTVNGSESGTSFRHALYFKEIGFNLHDTMIYQAEKPPLTHNRYEQKFEYMFILSKGKPKTFNGLREKSKYAGENTRKTFRHDGEKLQPNHKNNPVQATKLRGNVWTFAVGNNKSATDVIAHEHPAIFPEKLAQDHILSWSNPGDLILDPFMGSGTTGKVALSLNRNFIGMEIDTHYFNLAHRRIENSYPQPSGLKS